MLDKKEREDYLRKRVILISAHHQRLSEISREIEILQVSIDTALDQLRDSIREYLTKEY